MSTRFWFKCDDSWHIRGYVRHISSQKREKPICMVKRVVVDVTKSYNTVFSASSGNKTMSLHGSHRITSANNSSQGTLFDAKRSIYNKTHLGNARQKILKRSIHRWKGKLSLKHTKFLRVGFFVVWTMEVLLYPYLFLSKRLTGDHWLLSATIWRGTWRTSGPFYVCGN